MALPIPAPDGLRSMGPYLLQEKLGEGGMGVVYRAVHETTGEQVALKTVKVPHEHQLAGIRREILALSRLQHPGVVRVLATGLRDAVPWYAMELLEGETLSSLRERGFEGSAGRLISGEFLVPRLPSSEPDQPTLAGPEDLSAPAASSRPLYGPAAGGKLQEVLTILSRLCATLSYLHGEGVVHRDLKPSNIFVRSRLRPVLVDFGLVWRFGGGGREVLDISHIEAGTISYMAPEHFRGEFGDARSDLYSLGCILYELLTGRLPFEGSTLFQIRSAHLALTPPAPSSLVSGVEPELDRLVMTLLEKQPRQRVGHAEDVQEVLLRLGAEPDERMAPVRPRAFVYRPTLVGREEAMERLLSVLDRTSQGEGAVALLGGESGIGKTYLAMSFARQAMARGFLVVADSCVPGKDLESAPDAPLLPFRKLLQTVADRCIEHGPEGTALLLGPSVHLLAPYEPGLLNLPGADLFDAPPEVSAQAARERIVEALHGVLLAFLETSPLLLMIDDLQWIDDLSAQVLTTLPEGLFQRRLLVLGTFRSEQRSAPLERLLASQRAVEFPLSRLEEKNVEGLVSDMLATEKPPAKLVHFLTHRCKGNPFFVAEYLRAAVAEGFLARHQGQWTAAGDGAFEMKLPETLGELVLRRLSGLSAAGLQVLRGGAVLGKSFPGALLERLTEVHGEAWHGALNELQRAQMIEEDLGNLHILHDKLREVAYSKIPAGERAALHLRAGMLLEEEGAEPRLLADHFLAGRGHGKAARYLELAGQKALQTFSNREALHCYQQLIELDQRASATAPASWEEELARGLPEAPEGGEGASSLRRARWYHRMSEADFYLGDLSACLQHATTALGLLGLDPPRAAGGWAIELLRHLSMQLRHRWFGVPGRPRTAVEQASLAEASLLMQRLSERFYYNFDALPMIAASLASVNLGERASTQLQIAKPYGMLGMSVGLSKLHRLGHRYFDLGGEVAHRSNDQEGLTFCLYAKAAWLVGDGHWDDVRALCEEAIRIAEVRGAKQDISTAKTLIAQADFYSGSFEKSRDLFLEIGEDARRRSNPQHHAWGLYAAARALIPLGELERARGMLREAHALLEPQVEVPSKIITPGLLAQVAQRLGDEQEAQQMAALCTARIRQNLPTVFATVAGYAGVADVYLRRWERLLAAGDPGASEAGKVARRAVFDLLTLAFNIPLGWPYYHRLKGVELRISGHPDRASASFRKGIDRARELRMPHDEALNLLELARTLAPCRERSRSLDEAIRLFQQLHCPLDLQAAEALR
ncbi:MAG: DUF2791 family P-loop domain-containing protein [Polyangiaceae bacterium]|jgi:serine/threonine protein kinase/tetratricopeptide (TPR) repeat protein|nr:DUF2791 family P-loop domain-containing protein [Polyangiaceae bacterium]